MRGKWFAFGCLTSIIILIATLVLVFHSASNYMNRHSTEKKKLVSDTWLVLKLENEIKEFNELSDDFWGKKQSSAHNYIQKINQAAHDKNITGIILQPEYFSCGYATLDGIMAALQNFRDQGKSVFAYVNSTTNRGYYLTTVANRIYLNPSASAGILLTGVGGHILYYEQLLNKLGIDMQVIHAGKYKAAGEQFNRSDMSPEFRENLSSLYSDIYSQMISTIAANRNLTEAEVKAVYEDRNDIWLNGEAALKAGLVDELVIYKNFLERLKPGFTEQDEVTRLSINSYELNTLPIALNKIAVLYAEGSIMAQAEPALNVITAQKTSKLLQKIKDNPKIKAVVIRVNSPGGSALESELILNAVRDLQLTKPVVVSMGDVAASGGYYIACSADQIFADPMTITGSIGVVAMFPNLTSMGEKIGVNANTVKFGRYSDFLNPWEKPDPNELAAMQRSIMQVYDEFKSHVANGRDLTLNEVEDIAQGRVWSSKQALQNGLIDAVGSLDDAVKKAAELASVTGYQVEYYPEPSSLMDYFLKEYFDIEMAASIISGKVEQLDILNELQRLKAIQQQPRQAYCPVELN
ncbi:MAG: signal peptide peptidase SppA [Candidatus Cloacimonetes bacterium]|nr:signal peptide peptidase SppA [Candidatus Cloacimonadota bacterium]